MFHENLLIINNITNLFSDETLMPLLTIFKEAAQKENEY